jgi:hypothetical protein
MILTYRESSITREISPSLSPELFLVREQRKGRAPEIYQLVPQEVTAICQARRFRCANCGHSGDPLQGCRCGSADWMAVDEEVER